MRRRIPEPDRSELPADLAAGPDPELWRSSAEWHAAGAAWAKTHGLGPNGWYGLLPEDVGYAVSARGRHHIACGGLVPPWAKRHDDTTGSVTDR